MAPTLNARKPIVARANRLSSGEIAGTVVGCVIGGGLLLIILGFLYFRYRRHRQRSQETLTDFLPTDKGPVSHGHTSFPPEYYASVLPSIPQGQRPPVEHDRSGRPVPALDHGQHQQTPISPYDVNSMRDHEGYYTHQPMGPEALPPDIDFSLPRQPPPSSAPDASGPGKSLDHASIAQAAANSSYYDTRISMDSEPAQPFAPPSRQMTELYEAQLREAEEHRKRSGSAFSRFFGGISMKRKRSTQSSSHAPGSAHPSASQQFFPASPVESPMTIKQEAGSNSPQDPQLPSQQATNRYYEEPEELSESAAVPGPGSRAEMGGTKPAQDSQDHKRRKRWANDSQHGEFPLRTDTAIRETTEKDPELPSAALRRPDSTYGLPPVTQPPSGSQPQERLKSPDIPEPMELDGDQSVAAGTSVFRGSHSPPLPPETFVSPMAIMQPTNETEKAAYTVHQMENSASTPEAPASAPEVASENVTYKPHDDAAISNQEGFDTDQFLNIPEDDEYGPRRSSDSYDYSTTPGQSSTDPSSGRTPDTRITVSPSPFPTVHEHLKPEPESSSSPEASRLSSPPGHYACEDCGRQFDLIHKLNHHKRYHDRKHECTYPGCDKKFGTKTHLDRHINDKHEKSKAYHCFDPNCPYFKGGKAFPRKDNWRRHMIKKHGSTPSDLEGMDEAAG
ncbi:hypothetical protein F4778DRAFT_403561 [Xylariomycetidae sp. FL2044]|nr:hypothetical protein F4778DRAFT_403561 [Xylariomycetidae sp. FL2044]